VRFGLRIADVGLALLCARLAVGVATDLARALTWTPDPVEVLQEPSRRIDPPERSWSARERILERDLFHESIAGGPAPTPVPREDEVERTELALGLLGTIASTDSQIGAAAVWLDDAQHRVVLTEGDEIVGSGARIVEIERGRVVIAEEGELRELVFDADSEYRPPKRPTRRRRGRLRRR
jgi:type II secretory pathway component PulC